MSFRDFVEAADQWLPLLIDFARERELLPVFCVTPDDERNPPMVASIPGATQDETRALQRNVLHICEQNGLDRRAAVYITMGTMAQLPPGSEPQRAGATAQNGTGEIPGEDEMEWVPVVAVAAEHVDGIAFWTFDPAGNLMRHSAVEGGHFDDGLLGGWVRKTYNEVN